MQIRYKYIYRTHVVHILKAVSKLCVDAKKLLFNFAAQILARALAVAAD